MMQLLSSIKAKGLMKGDVVYIGNEGKNLEGFLTEYENTDYLCLF